MFGKFFSRVSRPAFAAGVGVLGGGLTTVAFASHANYPQQKWPDKGMLDLYDAASLRRGFEVYRQICSTCHSLQYLSYRELIGITHTEEQAKALARSIEVTDGPNDSGEMFQRPGKLFDHLPSPYANEEQARFANGGAAPPDLSLVVTARPGEADYIFALLTGYVEAPAGIQLREGLHYNHVFGGNAISMPAPLSDGQLEYEDGTPASVSQMAKDVTHFLTWTSMPEQDQRRLMGARSLLAFGIAFAGAAYSKRFFWASLKNRRISYPSDGRY